MNFIVGLRRDKIFFAYMSISIIRMNSISNDYNDKIRTFDINIMKLVMIMQQITRSD